MKRNEYFTADGFSASKIKMYEDNHDMLSFINSTEFDFQDKELSTESMLFGELFHLAVLEPLEFQNKQELILDGFTPAKAKLLNNMLKTMPTNKTAVNILKSAKFVEFPVFGKYTIEHNNKKLDVIIKGFIDLYTKQEVLVDLKTVKSLNNFYSQFKLYRYDLQFAFYKRLLEYNKHKVANVICIAVEKAPPFGWQCFYIPESELMCGEFGYGKYRGFKEIMTEMFFEPKKRFEDELVVLEKDSNYAFE